MAFYTATTAELAVVRAKVEAVEAQLRELGIPFPPREGEEEEEVVEAEADAEMKSVGGATPPPDGSKAGEGEDEDVEMTDAAASVPVGPNGPANTGAQQQQPPSSPPQDKGKGRAVEGEGENRAPPSERWAEQTKHKAEVPPSTGRSGPAGPSGKPVAGSWGSSALQSAAAKLTPYRGKSCTPFLLKGVCPAGEKGCGKSHLEASLEFWSEWEVKQAQRDNVLPLRTCWLGLQYREDFRGGFTAEILGPGMFKAMAAYKDMAAKEMQADRADALTGSTVIGTATGWAALEGDQRWHEEDSLEAFRIYFWKWRRVNWESTPSTRDHLLALMDDQGCGPSGPEMELAFRQWQKKAAR